MSYSRSDFEGSAMVECPCGATHPASYRLSGCDVKACDYRGCHLCIRECSNCALCGRFCDLHLEEGLCPACTKLDFAAEDLIEAERIAA